MENSNMLPKKWKFCTEGNCEIPDRPRDIADAKRKEEQIATGTKMICTNWGCGEEYEYSEDKHVT